MGNKGTRFWRRRRTCGIRKVLSLVLLYLFWSFVSNPSKVSPTVQHQWTALQNPVPTLPTMQLSQYVLCSEMYSCSPFMLLTHKRITKTDNWNIKLSRRETNSNKGRLLNLKKRKNTLHCARYRSIDRRDCPQRSVTFTKRSDTWSTFAAALRDYH